MTCSCIRGGIHGTEHFGDSRAGLAAKVAANTLKKKRNPKRIITMYIGLIKRIVYYSSR